MDEFNKPVLSDSKLEVVKYKKPNPNKKFWILLLITVVLLTVMYFWKEFEVSKAEKAAEKKIEEAKLRAHRSVIAAHEEHLKLLSRPFVWALRTEMLSGNTAQVGQYSNEMVKEKGFRHITIVDNQGVVISATDKKNEGLNFSTLGTGDLLNNNNTIVQNLGDTSFIISSPIMGFDRRLGTLIIDYSMPAFNSK